MIAFAIMALVLSATALGDYGAQYWNITSQTSSEALSQAKTTLENLRAISGSDFQSATSSPLQRVHDASCDSGGLCYYVQTLLTNISSCAKYAEADVSWQVPGYPTSTAALFTTLEDTNEAVKQGADCGINWPSGDWTRPVAQSIPLAGTPTGIDVLNGTVFISESKNPALQIFLPLTNSLYSFTSADGAAFNAVDVARDMATGRTYAYVAATSTQFRVLDVTDPTAPAHVASSTLAGVPPGLAAGWRLVAYDRFVYLTTLQTNSKNAPEFHVFSVSRPTVPTEVGTGFKLNTSVYGITVRDQYVRGAMHRYAFLATTLSSAELMVLDVTDPTKITKAASCDLPGAYQGTSVSLLGNVLYVGRENVPSGGADVYAYDATDPTAASFCTPLGQTDINTDLYSRHVQGVRATGPYLFLATNNTTNAHGQIQVRSADAAKSFPVLGTYALDALVETGIDYDALSGTLYGIGAGSSPTLRILTSTP